MTPTHDPPLPVMPYLEQRLVWPERGEHILAHQDAETLIVYQAYKPSIGRFATTHGRLGGADFSLSRMSWIKPNFLWMMYRSGWGTKRDHEITLGLRISRAFFAELLDAAIPSAYRAGVFESEEAWQQAVSSSDVRSQWDPDHDPYGGRLERRALQLGLRGEALRRLVEEETREVIDMSAFVAAQRERLATGGLEALSTPVETVSPHAASR